MSDKKELINAFAAAWNAVAPEQLGGPSTLGLLALREVGGEQMAGALNVAATWSAAFAAECHGAGASGILVCLFKSEDCEWIERAIGRPSMSGEPKAGTRVVVGAAFEGAAAQFSDQTSTALAPGETQFIDLSSDEALLARIVGGHAWVGTFALTGPGQVDTQALLLYAPEGSLASLHTKPAPQPAAAPVNAPNAAPTPPSTPAVNRRSTQRRDEPAPKNFERLLDVELGVVVRFGVTTVPLRDVVRMGAGSMIELSRAVDEPVELLVNGRVLARGEVVVVDGYYGVRVTEIGSALARTASLL